MTELYHYRSFTIVITDHAYERMKERFNLGKKPAKSTVTKALAHGNLFMQKQINDEISISSEHHKRLFKFIVKEDKLVCTTAHPIMSEPSDKFVVHVKGKLTNITNNTKMRLKTVYRDKSSKFKKKRKGNEPQPS